MKRLPSVTRSKGFGIEGLAEAEGVEPPRPVKAHTVFKTGAVATSACASYMADGKGFEPLQPVRANRISNAVPLP